MILTGNYIHAAGGEGAFPEFQAGGESGPGGGNSNPAEFLENMSIPEKIRSPGFSALPDSAKKGKNIFALLTFPDYNDTGISG